MCTTRRPSAFWRSTSTVASSPTYSSAPGSRAATERGSAPMPAAGVAQGIDGGAGGVRDREGVDQVLPAVVEGVEGHVVQEVVRDEDQVVGVEAGAQGGDQLRIQLGQMSLRRQPRRFAGYRRDVGGIRARPR